MLNFLIGDRNLKRMRDAANRAAEAQYDPTILDPLRQQAAQQATEGLPTERIRQGALASIFRSTQPGQMSIFGGDQSRAISGVGAMDASRATAMAGVETQVGLADEQARLQGRGQLAEILSRQRETIGRREAAIERNQAMYRAERSRRRGMLGTGLLNLGIAAFGPAIGAGVKSLFSRVEKGIGEYESQLPSANLSTISFGSSAPINTQPFQLTPRDIFRPPTTESTGVVPEDLLSETMGVAPEDLLSETMGVAPEDLMLDVGQPITSGVGGALGEALRDMPRTPIDSSRPVRSDKITSFGDYIRFLLTPVSKGWEKFTQTPERNDFSSYAFQTRRNTGDFFDVPDDENPLSIQPPSNLNFGVLSPQEEPNVEQNIISNLTERGFEPHVIAGIMGNLSVESGFDSSINEINPIVQGSRGGFGLAQWTGPRRRELEAAARQAGVDPSDVNFQLEFMMRELETTERGAYNRLMSASTAEEAAQIFSDYFLRPGIPHMDRRQSETQRILSVLTNN